MSKFVIRVLVFFTAFAIIDVIFGRGMDYFYKNVKGGEIKETNDVCLNNQYDIVVMGSSRAHHHYVPEILKDSVGANCYNIGKDGNGIVLMYGFYKMIAERYNPSLIIYDVSRFDVYEIDEDQNNTRYISMLKPYSNYSGIEEIFKSLSWKEWVKTYSNLYRYNSITFETIRQCYFPTSFNEDGYMKQEGVIENDLDSFEYQLGKKDALKISLFKEFVASTKEKGIPLVCVLSPNYHAGLSDVYDTIIMLCEADDIPFLDYYSVPDFQHKEYFKDHSHMNDFGARVFTCEVAKAIDTIMKN